MGLEAVERGELRGASQTAAPRVQAPSGARLGYIDGLRAVAVAGVVFTHAFDLSPTPWAEFNRLATLGRHGVELFFVISGFCLSYPYLRRFNADRHMGFEPAAFFAKRALRIIPPYYVAIFLALALYKLANMTCDACAPVQVVQQLLFLDQDRKFVIPQGWTLPIEMRWYFLFPAILLLYARSLRLYLLTGLSCYVLYLFTLVQAPDVECLPAFMAGIIAADVALRDLPIARLGLPAFIASLPALILFEPTSAQLDPVASAAAFFLVIGATRPGLLSNILGLRIVRFFGVCSYSIYLVHEPVMRWAVQYGGRPLLLGVLISLAASIGFWFVVERPITETPLKAAILRRVTPGFEAAFGWLGFPSQSSTPRQRG